MTSQFHDLNNKLSALVENLGPSIVTTVPLGDHIGCCLSCSDVFSISSAAWDNTFEVSLQNVGCIGMWQTVPKLGPLETFENMYTHIEMQFSISISTISIWRNIESLPCLIVKC